MVRKPSLVEKAVDFDEFHAIAWNLPVAAEDDYLKIFGPLSDGDASACMQHQLERLGLSYLDDYYALDLYLPSWLSVGIAFRPH